MSADATDSRFANRLVREKSPYLRQHAHNPVDWYPWGPEALETARRDDRPIFLSVGYSACHWCHVMERESFEDAATARLLNEHFVPIKVDREERPDVDEIYMTAVQLLTGQGGWPMSVFLTPDGRPFYGGTYFPPDDRGGRPGFKSLLRQLAHLYAERRDEIERVADQITEDLRRASRPAQMAPVSGSPQPVDLLTAAVADLQERFDARNGGFGGAPKFPPHHALALLLEATRRGDASAAPLLIRTLDKMAQGGIYDQIGGGFHRYATDAVWLVPHFEKMLYDNALLAGVYANAFVVTGEARYARIARETCDWVLRDLLDPAGGFHAALDADSEGEEGRYYVWTWDEVRDALGDENAKNAAARFAERYNLRPGGNFRDEATGRPTGTNIPHWAGDDLPDEQPPALADARARLLARRDARVPPGKDNKVITAWNGLMIGGLARAGHALNEPRYIEAAERAAAFCLSTLRPEGRLLRRYADGEAALDAYLEDYAFLADGLLDLHDATGEPRWANEARALADTLLAEFWDDAEGGFFFVGARHETLIARTKDLFDGALPSPNGVAARVLARLAALPGGETYRQKAAHMLHAFGGAMERVPGGTQTLVLAALRLAPDEAIASEKAPRGDAQSPIATLIADGPSPLRVAPGQAATATFTFTLAPGWHVHARTAQPPLLPTIAAVASDLPAAVGPVVYPAPIPWQSGEELLPTYQGVVRFEVPITTTADAAPGAYRLSLILRFQPCGESSCLAPDEQQATLAVEIVR